MGLDHTSPHVPQDKFQECLRLNPRIAHLAFCAPDRQSVDDSHQEALNAGGKDNGKPGLRTSYRPDYYSAFVIDAAANNIEAVCYNP